MGKCQFTQLDHKVHELETEQRRSARVPNQLHSQFTAGQGATHRQRGHSASLSPSDVVPPQKTQSQWPSPSSNPAAESQVASLEEAAQKLQRHVAESLDNLVAVYQCKMAACEAQTIHGQQQ